MNGSLGRANFGGSNAVGPHSLSQVFSTTAGETYVLEFNYRDDHGNLNQQMQVTVDGSANLLTTEQILTDTNGSSFIRYRYTFTADSSSATITFTDTSDNVGSQSASTIGVSGAIDDVSVRQTGGSLGTVSYTEDSTAVVLAGRAGARYRSCHDALRDPQSRVDAALQVGVLDRGCAPDGPQAMEGEAPLLTDGMEVEGIGQYKVSGGVR